MDSGLITAENDTLSALASCVALPPASMQSSPSLSTLSPDSFSISFPMKFYLPRPWGRTFHVHVVVPEGEGENVSSLFTHYSYIGVFRVYLAHDILLPDSTANNIGTYIA
jgi:hypothetical protein